MAKSEGIPARGPFQCRHSRPNRKDFLVYYLLSYDGLSQVNNASWTVKLYEEYADIPSCLDRAGELIQQGKAVHIEPIAR
ncbi:hypothetical protein [Ralstonia phage phiITL-1]|uniref:Uncharacterized protein n=1 Tax=Ralstonia phage phiITL-1 TaxID=1597967 RepID=A0A0U1ZGT5_9CAUD|nr:hypothetical protein HOR02_gp16 [Ralstonia phage phiITL-1]AJT60800.1 hypothetical protein [Ralstonia phage phiITL-1]